MKNKTKLTGVELNCIEVAVQHYIDELEDVITDKHTSVLMSEKVARGSPGPMGTVFFL